jgi:hypothetical protein
MIPFFHSRSAAFSFIAGVSVLASLAAGVHAGDAKAVLDKQPAELVPDTGWQFTMVAPGWLAGIEGTIGVRGVEGYVDDSFSDIIDNLGILGAASVEGRNGKFGFILEGIYTKTVVGGPTPGPLLSTVSIEMEQLLAEGTLTYRILDTDRAWIELLAGARYTYLGTDLSMTVDSAGVRTASENVSSEIIDRASATVRQEVARRLASLTAGLAAPAADIPEGRMNPLEESVLNRNGGFRDPFRDRLERGLGRGRTGLGDRLFDHGPLRRAIRDYVDAKVESEIEAARASASAAVGAARAGNRAAVDRRLARAEANLANAIERRIQNALPDEELHASKAWVDPFIGFRGRVDLNDQLYLTGRGDIGVFGVSSDLAWNVYGALGTDLTERTCVEVGYRYYQDDYERGAFLYNTALHGPFIGVRIDY